MARLAVTLSGIRVGTLVQDRWEGHFFEPDATWLAGGQRPVLGLHYLQTLDRRTAPRRSTHLPVWFENLLPERDSELRRLLCAHLGIRSGQSFRLLGELGRDLPGAVMVTPENGDTDDTVDSEQTSGEPDPLRFSLAGAQLKFSMAKQGTAFTVPAKGTAGDWIVKIPGSDLPLLPQVELCTMQWARSTGLPVPECEITPVSAVSGLEAFGRHGVRAAFAVRRFDRQPGGGRVHQEDFNQVLNLAPDHRYGDSGPLRASTTTIARVVRDACGSDALFDLLDRISFILASGNGDAHLKNFSLVYPDPSPMPRLSPCYDLVSTISCDAERFGWELRQGPSLALKLGNARLFRRLGSLDIEALAHKLGLDTSQTVEHVLATLRQTREAFADVADAAPEPMRLALREHWSKVPLLVEAGDWPY